MKTWLLCICFGYIAGVVVWQAPFAMPVALVCVGICTVLFLVLQERYWCIACVVCACMFLGIAHRSHVEMIYATNQYDLVSVVPQEFSGNIVRPVVMQQSRQHAVVRVTHQEGAPVSAEYNVLVYVPFSVAVSYGDTLVFTGALERPRDFVTDTGRVFGYRNYLAAKRIVAVSEPSSITITEEGSGFGAQLFMMRSRMLQSIETLMPRPHSALVSGVLLGVDQGFGKELERVFRVVGLTHIVVLSGYNMALVALVIRGAFVRVLGRSALVLAVVGTILFAFFVGGGPTVVRATIMVVLTLLATGMGRVSDGVYGLVLAGTGMVAAHPMIALFDIGFLLSIGATLGVLLFTEPLLVVFRGLPSILSLREVVATTLAAQIGVLPLLMYMLGEISLVGIIANILVVPVVPVLMVLGVCMICTAWIPGVSALIAWGTTWLVEGVFLVVEFLARVPFASVQVSEISLGVFLGIWIGVFALYLVLLRYQRAHVVIQGCLVRRVTSTTQFR